MIRTRRVYAPKAADSRSDAHDDAEAPRSRNVAGYCPTPGLPATPISLGALTAGGAITLRSRR